MPLTVPHDRARAGRETISRGARSRPGAEPRLDREVRTARLQPLTRWRIATAVLAVTTGFFALRGRGERPAVPPAPGAGIGASGAVAGSRAATLRQLRIPGNLVGLDEDAILRDLARAGSVQQIQVLCERLGFVGTDHSLDLLGKLAHDRRPGVAEAAIAAVGHIGTDSATSLLLQLLDGTGMRVRGAAVAALARTGQPEAKQRLLQLARTRGDAQRIAAISALGEVGGRDVIDLFRAMPDRSRPVLYAMVQAAATMGDEDAQAFLSELARSGDVHAEIRAAALAALPAAGDDERQAMMMEVLASGDPASAASAAEVLGHARAQQAVPLLLDVARSGNYQTSYAALSALGEIASPEAVRALGELVGRGPQNLAPQAAMALAQADTPEARAMLLQSARAPGGDHSAALSALMQMGGKDVEQLLVDVAKSGDMRDRQSALQYLVQMGHPEASAMVVDLATHGPRQQRQGFMYMLTQLDGDAARDALWGMAKGSSGYSRMQAIEMLAQANPSDPKLSSMLVDLAQNGRSDEVGSAANGLARIGTPEAHDALMSLLSSGDAQHATAALGAMGQMLGDPDIASAVLQAGHSGDPQVRAAALQQLVGSGLPEGMKLAEEMLKSGRSEDGARALQAVMGSNLPEAQALVREAAGQEDVQVRAMAASAMASSMDPAATQSLIGLSRDRDPQVRAAALNSLGQVGTDEAVRVLLDATRGGETASRQAAIQALAYTDDARAAGVIAEFIKSSDPDLASSAISVSGNGGREVDQALLAALSSENEQIRSAAAYQLRSRGTRLGPDAQRQVDALVGPR
jgi:HEAT repeat protein